MTKKIYRTDQIGSLLRSPELMDARDDYKAGKISREALRAEEDKAILWALDLQKQAGVEVFCDGEFRRDGYQTGISEAVDGFAAEYPVQEDRQPDGKIVRIVHHSKPIVGKLKPRSRIADVDASFMVKNSPGPFKITLISPVMVAWRGFKKGLTDKAYPDPAELLNDLVNITADEMNALADQGVPYIQVDMGFARYVRDDLHEAARAAGVNLEAEVARDIEAENRLYAAVKKKDVTFGIHICRGNRNAFNQARGGYDWMAEQVFSSLNVDRFLFEWDSDRSGGFEALRFLPKGKVVVLGLVSTKNPKLETVDDLRRRIDEAASFCSLDQLALSAQCGFHGASDRDAMHISVDDQQRKLELIAETARRVWS